MRKTTNSTKTLLLPDSSIVRIHSVREWFRKPAAEKIISPCKFRKTHQIRYFRYRKHQDETVTLTAVTAEKIQVHAKDTNFVKAYIKLVRIFGDYNI